MELDGFDVQLMLGGKVVEMAERLKTAHAVAPGAVATFKFILDEMPFTITLSVPKADGQ